MKTHITVNNVQKVFKTPGKDVVALKDINLEIRAGEFVCLLGPSGCGKSTLLNAVAGFALPSSGEITVEGKEIVGPGPDRGMVFQEYALFPWMTVAQNIAFGLQVQNKRKDEIGQTVNVKVIMATNRADTLDPALLRPGRLDRKIEFPTPDRRQKRLVFATVTSKMNLSEEVDLEDCPIGSWIASLRLITL